MDALSQTVPGNPADWGVVLMATVQDVVPETCQPLSLRADLRTYARTDGRVVLEDPVEGKHYRLGATEYRFVAHLSHSGNPSLAHQAATAAESEWTLDCSKQLMGWLTQRGMVQNTDLPRAAQPDNRRHQKPSKDLLFLRISFGSPEAWTSPLVKILKPLLGRWNVWFLVSLMLVAMVGFITQWSKFSAAYTGLTSPRGAVSLVTCGLLLKVLHELGHCITCQAYGGRMREWGVLLICGVPLPFVDASDSRRFPSRSARIVVALAGVLVEAVAVGLAVVSALVSDSPLAYYVAAHMVLTLGVSAILFNLNPLMKFDGYYVLTEFLRIDNLYPRGSDFVRQLGARLFFGRKPASPANTPLPVRFYGVASYLWRTFAIVTIACLAIRTLHGVGVVLVAWTLWWLWCLPGLRAAQQTIFPPKTTSVGDRLIRILRPLAWIGMLLAAGFLIPLPFKTKTYATVEYDPPSMIRSPTNAFVEEVHVSDNQYVERGELLFTLRSDAIAEKLAKFEAACERHQLHVRAALSNQDMHELKVAQSLLEAAREQHRQVVGEATALKVRSPVAGTISAQNLDELIGSYLVEGCEIAAVGQEGKKRLRALVDADEDNQLVVGETIRYLTWAGESGEAVVDSILPRATHAANNTPLGANLGGPLEVQTDKSGDVRFVTPQIPVLAKLDPEQSLAIHVGQRVSVSIGTRKQLAEWFWETLWRER